MMANRIAALAAGVAVAGIVGVTSIMTVGTAGAAKREEPRGRDVVTDAQEICVDTDTDPANLRAACYLLADTQVATFEGRNAVKNLEAQSRKAASVVLSLDDVHARDKVPGQVQTAMDDACAYAAKSADLLAVGKVTYADGRDLGKDAKELAASIYTEWAGEYGDDIANPCAA